MNESGLRITEALIAKLEPNDILSDVSQSEVGEIGSVQYFRSICQAYVQFYLGASLAAIEATRRIPSCMGNRPTRSTT
jgi:hypothetical protein